MKFLRAMGASAADLFMQLARFTLLQIIGLCLAVWGITELFLHFGWGAAGIAQVIVLSLVIMVPVTLMGWKEGKPSKWAFIGGLVYTASYFISNSWHLAFWLLDPLPQEISGVVGQIMEGAPVSAYGFALRIDQANKRLLVAVYCFTTFFALSKHDLQARMIWLVTAIAETFGFLENVECRLWQDPLGSHDYHLAAKWGIEVSRYACGRAFTSWAPYMPPIITSLYLIYANSSRRFRS